MVLLPSTPEVPHVAPPAEEILETESGLSVSFVSTNLIHFWGWGEMLEVKVQE